ncbi:hypothetical protein LIER_29023 [Lithospermum erythrorhizon]|uniref:Reverse transcriptase Ty1/copia-type domain-containing protein n=1 Tax=Lithospermum erythrorhizon TaxID=34254 RepID=A0AAV3RJC0_LITER
MTSIRTTLGLAIHLDLVVEQLDVKTTFLHGYLEEDIFMEQPEGFMTMGKEQIIYDTLIVGNDISKINVLKQQLRRAFEMKDWEVSTMSKEDVEGMVNVPYASAVGSLMYGMLCTRPDIAYFVGLVSRFLSQPRKEYWEAVKWILRYLKGLQMCVCYGGQNATLESFTDSDMVGDIDSKKSTSGYLF